jgi:anti-sigma regulatory factor (Ser/Thr protein kinase)/putative methionine-R-sulfoxide reductase with GAF domain
VSSLRRSHPNARAVVRPMPAPPGETSPSAEDRLERIRSITDSALAHLDAEDLLVELLDRAREALDTDTAAILLLRESSQELVATAARGLEEEVRQDSRVPLGQGFAGRIAAERRPIALTHIDDGDVVNPILRAKGLKSLLGVPLLADGHVTGVLHVGTLTTRHFTDEDVELLQMVGDRVALAVRARLATAERTAGAALQRSLVPERLPRIPGLDLASRYVPAEDGGVGGDWYDLFTVPSGHVCITIGDVVGRGLRAAVVMGRLRSTVRAYALEVVDPPEVLQRVDRKLQHFEASEMATVLFAVIDPSLQHIRISLAGHPPPVMARPGEAAHLLDLPVDPPLGVGRRLERRGSTVELSPGSLLCFFTDGLVERRRVPLDQRLRQLTDCVTADPPDEVCRTVMAHLVASDATSDDIAVLALRRQGQGAIRPLHMQVPAVPGSLGDIRVAVRRWLSATAAEPDDITDLLVATGEACSNAIEHAYGAGGGTVTVRLELDPSSTDVVVATIRDSGQWRSARGQNRGRGIRLMEASSDDVAIVRGPEGTEVTIRRHLGRPRPG